MRDGNSAFQAAMKLAEFVGTTYNIHIALVTAILGGMSAAYVNGTEVALEVRLVLLGLYVFVALSSLVFLFDLYSRINAANALACKLMVDELGKEACADDIASIRQITKPVKGYVYRFLFPLITVVFAIMIARFPVPSP